MKYTRDIVVYAIFALMAYLVVKDPHDKILQGAMIAAFGAAYGYYLNASKTGSETAAKNADAVTNALRNANETQPVVVTNDEDAPVPVEPK